MGLPTPKSDVLAALTSALTGSQNTECLPFGEVFQGNVIYTSGISKKFKVWCGSCFVRASGYSKLQVW